MACLVPLLEVVGNRPVLLVDVPPGICIGLTESLLAWLGPGGGEGGITRGCAGCSNGFCLIFSRSDVFSLGL